MDDRTADHASETKPFQFSGRIRSFRHAIAGVLRMIQCQHNAWIHAAATLVALAAAFVLRISAADWCWIILAISIVWTAEALTPRSSFSPMQQRHQTFTLWFAMRRMLPQVLFCSLRLPLWSSVRLFSGRMLKGYSRHVSNNSPRKRSCNTARSMVESRLAKSGNLNGLP